MRVLIYQVLPELFSVHAEKCVLSCNLCYINKGVFHISTGVWICIYLFYSSEKGGDTNDFFKYITA